MSTAGNWEEGAVPTAGSKLVFKCVEQINGIVVKNDLTVALSGLETKRVIFLLVGRAPAIILIRCNLRQMLNLLVAGLLTMMETIVKYRLFMLTPSLACQT